MPKLGMEPIRRAALVEATIHEIGAAGSLDVTVSQIAKRAGMSSALAHHYFGGKEQIFLAAMRHTLTVYAAEVRGALAMAETPFERTEAIIRAGFSQSNFRREVIAAWLNFYVLAQTSSEARRLLTIYQRRLNANLLFNLRQIAPDRAPKIAKIVAGLIDGIYLREALANHDSDGNSASQLVIHALQRELDATE
jgi:TetR/AcrR family transcriptional repressor of bet genes